jgi:SAM-dependent methyltransferase
MGANQSQANYWSNTPGLKWIQFEEQLDIVFEAVNEALIERARPKFGERVIDIGCGTGATARAFASRLGAAGSVTAVDISAPLLSHAMSRSTDSQAISDYRLVDAQTEPIGENDFDLATSRFGAMFFQDPVAAFSNINKALRPSGRLVVVGWAAIDGNPWFEVPLDGAVARLGPADRSDPNGPGPLGFQNTEHVICILERAGFSNVIGERARITLRHPGPVEDVAALAANIGPAARILEKYNGGKEDVEAITSHVICAFRKFDTAEGVRIPARLNFFSARKPPAGASSRVSWAEDRNV